MDTLIHSSSEEETKKAAHDFALTLEGGEILCLHGDLGAGKTTFTSHLAAALGVTERVVSPTYILLRSYETGSDVIQRLHHIDAYRVESIDELEALGMDELLDDIESVLIIEWAENIQEGLPEKRVIDISFEFEGEGRRIQVARS